MREAMEGEAARPGPGEGDPVESRPFRRREVFLLARDRARGHPLVVFEIRLPPFTSAQTVSQNVFFFLLINLNIVLILLVVFLLGRNIVKLVVERRQRVLGSHLRTRLVAGFVGVAIAPAVFLFLVALGFIRTSIESWFSVQIESALEGSIDMADAYYRESMATALREAEELARRLGASNRRVDADAAIVGEKQREYGAAAISVYDAEGKLVASAAMEGLSDDLRPPPDRAFPRASAGAAGEHQHVRPFGGDLLRATARIEGRDGTVRGAVIVDQVVPASIVRRRDDIEESSRQYKQLRLLRRPLINNYVLTLLLASLVVLFGGTWLGFAIARSITGPIQRLAEGTRRVAAGNLDEQIPLESGSDEVATLVEAFNQMTANLRATHAELAERSRTLETILANIGGGVVSIDPEAGSRWSIRRRERCSASRSDRAACRSAKRLPTPTRARPDAARRPRAPRARGCLGSPAAAPHVDRTPERRGRGAGERRRAARRGGRHDRRAALPRGRDRAPERAAHGGLARGRAADRARDQEPADADPALGAAPPQALRRQGRRRGPEECTRTIIAQVELLKNLVSEFAHFARLPAGSTCRRI
jgi:two-component system nitrogen regulation sensor histidine kinase NtrY